jgi:hypothetical protein
LERIGATMAANGERMITPVAETRRTTLDMLGLTEDDLKANVASS